MIKKRKIFVCAAAVLFLAGLIGSIFLAGRFRAGTVLADKERKEADAYIASLKRYQSESVELKEHEDGYYYDIVKAQNLGEYMLNRAGNTVIYPGAVLRGDSLMQGTTEYTLVTQKRTPMTLSCSPGGKTFQIEDITYGTVNAVVEKFCKEAELKYGQQCEYRYYSGQDERYLGGGFGASGEYSGISASGNVSAGSTEKNSRIFLIFTETYFTVKAEPFDSASKYFQIQSMDVLESLGDYEPAYVSSVDYGRILVADIEASMSEQELMGEIDAGTKGYDLNANGFFDYFSQKNDFNCRVYCYGGDLGKSYEEIIMDEENMNQMIVPDESLVNPVPVAYHLNYISDNSAVPAMQIMEMDEIRQENAKLVSISLEGKNMEGTFQLDDTTIGSVINTDRIYITDKGKTTEDIQFIWDTQASGSKLKGSFDGEEVIISLDGIPLEEYQEVWSKKKLLSFFRGAVKIKVRISDVLDEIL